MYGQHFLKQVASVDDPCQWHHVCSMFVYDSFVLLYTIKFSYIVNVLNIDGNGHKTTLINGDATKCKGGEPLGQINIELT
jgi:hypothetical protein